MADLGWARHPSFHSAGFLSQMNATSHTRTLKLYPEEHSGQSTSQGFTCKSLLLHNTEKGLGPKALLC